MSLYVRVMIHLSKPRMEHLRPACHRVMIHLTNPRMEHLRSACYPVMIHLHKNRTMILSCRLWLLVTMSLMKFLVRGAGCPACWGYSWPQPSRFITYTLNDLRCDPFSMTHVCMGCRLTCKKTMRLSKTIDLAGCVSSFPEPTASAYARSHIVTSTYARSHVRI